MARRCVPTMPRQPHEPIATRKRAGRSLSTICLAILLAWLETPLPAASASLYRIDQRNGTIAFSVSILGMFDVHGSFPRFDGELLLDTVHPEQSHIDVAIDANAVEMPLSAEVDLLRSAAYFDVAHYRTEHFVSTSIEVRSPSHYLIHGTLQIRGINQPQDIDAVVEDHHLNTKRGIEFVDFVVTGRIRRSAFGMVANRITVSDTVRLRIRIRLANNPTANAG